MSQLPKIKKVGGKMIKLGEEEGWQKIEEIVATVGSIR